MHLPEYEMLPNKIKFWGGSLDQILEKYNLSVKDHSILIDYCKKLESNICVLFCAKAIDVLKDLGVDGFKIGSGELTNIPMIERLLKLKNLYVFLWHVKFRRNR